MQGEWGKGSGKTPTERLTPEVLRVATSTADRLLRGSHYLVALTGPAAGRRYSLERELTVGRDPAASVQLAATDVSRRHARLFRTPEGEAYVEDLGSLNGTQVNGTAMQKLQLRHGDQVQFGASAVFLFLQSSPIEEQLALEQRMEAVGRLAGGVAHDLNNLLAVVVSDTEFLRRGFEDGAPERGEAKECLGNIECAARRASSLVQQLIGFARRGKYETRHVDVGQLVEEAVAVLRSSLDPRITVRLDLQLDLAVQGDPAQLHLVMMNLCHNARDAMPEGGAIAVGTARIEITGVTAARMGSLRPGPHVVITVQDTGVGMDSATCQHAFDPFFTTKDVGQGTGLGLASVYGIVKNHGGHVEVESEPGWGTTFRVYLPLATVVSEREGDRQTTPAMQAVHHTVLVVEDAENERILATRNLIELGYDVIGARDGREAIRLFVAHRREIEIVLLDLILPNLSGKDAFRWLRKLAPNVNVLLTSAYMDRGRVQELLEEGACGFLPKPYDREALHRAILMVVKTADVASVG